MATIRRIITVFVIFGAGLAAGLAPSTLLADADPGPEQIVFEPAQSTGLDPFTPPAISASGPFGGTGSDDRCDKELLISFLVANPDRLAAWAKVQGLSPADVPDYIRSLTPKILTEPTRVTNHGFRNGRAYAFQSVLDAGTAVLVDEHGKIVVRCRCGNPLDIPKCPDCEPDDKCPDGWDRPRRGEECEPPDDRCPERLYSTVAHDECEPPDDECPDPLTSSSVTRECEPPTDEDCPEYPATHGYNTCPDDEPRRPRPGGRRPGPDPVDPDPDPQDPGHEEPDPGEPEPERPRGPREVTWGSPTPPPTPQ